jgi:UDP-3-O-[3-hydroxymyristoyl] glucosamine N-acyltransferase
MGATLGELAVRFGCELRGDPSVRIDRVATLAAAGPHELAFLANPRYRPQLATTHAGAVVLDSASAASNPVASLVSGNPHATYARIAAVLHPVPQAPAGVHPTALVATGAHVDPSAHVAAYAIVGKDSRIGARAVIGAHCIVGERVTIGDDSRLVARVTLLDGVTLGERCLVHPGTVIGSDGFGLAPDRGTWVKVPQVGSVRIGSDVEIGANTTIDRGALDDTIIEDGVKLDNQIQIGHNTHIGAHSALAGCVGVSGSTVIGKRCMIGGAVGLAGHLTLADDVVITGMSLVAHSITEPGVYSSAFPAIDARLWRRIVGRTRRLDILADRVKALETRAPGAGSGPDAKRSDDDD